MYKVQFNTYLVYISKYIVKYKRKWQRETKIRYEQKRTLGWEAEEAFRPRIATSLAISIAIS